MSETIRKYKNLSNEDLGNLYLDMLHFSAFEETDEIVKEILIRFVAENTDGIIEEV